MARFTPSRRTLGLTALSSLVLAACGGGSSGGSGGSGGGGWSSSSSTSTSSSSSSSASSSTLPDPATAPALKTHFSGKFKIGMAIEPARLTETVSRPLLIKHANSITAENAMKPHAISPSEGVYNFTEADKLIKFAQDNGMEVRGHALVWHSSAPDWFFAGNASSAGYKATVRKRLEDYITAVCTHFKGKVVAWDVVNEVASDGTETYRDSRWYQVLGNDYIEYAFRAARLADPGAKLIINDYSTEDPAKLGRLMTIVQTMLDRGVPIDGVGHQFHINSYWPPIANIKAALDAAKAKGLVNHVTELDISVYNDPGSCYGTPSSGCRPEIAVGTAVYNNVMRDQATKYRELFNHFASRKDIESVSMWGVADDHTWLNTFPTPRRNYPFMFDATGKPKNSFWAVVDPAFVI